MAHRKPKQEMPDWFVVHNDCLTEMEEGVKVVSNQEGASEEDKRYDKMPPIFVRFLFLERLGFNGTAKSVVKTRTEK